MELDISYLPKHYYNSNPDLGGFFPFGYKGTPLHVFILSNLYLPRINNDFIPILMGNINAYPIYFCAEITSDRKKEFEKICHTEKVTYEYINNNIEFVVTKVVSESQLRALYPFYVTTGCINNLVLWSLGKNVFSLKVCKWVGTWEGYKETVVVEFDDNTSVFWIGYDGDSIVGLSNNPQFSTYHNMCSLLPEFVNPSESELE